MTPLLDGLAFHSVQLTARILGRLPASAGRVIAHVLSYVVYFVIGRRRDAYADLKAAFGDRFNPGERKRIIRESFAHIILSAIEVMRFPYQTPDDLNAMVDIHHLERYHEAVARGKGVVFLTAHFGNFELLQTISSGVFGRPIHVLGREQKNPRLNALLARYRESHGSVAVQRGMNTRDLIRALRRCELVGILGDQSAGKKQGILVSLFGRKTTLPTGAFELAARTGAVILPAFIARRGGGKHEIFVEEPIDMSEVSAAAEGFRPVIEKYRGMIEHFVRADPAQWLWAKKRWKYSWTKRILILSDEKPGHVKQSQAVARGFSRIKEQYGREGMEYPARTLTVRFRSRMARRIFPLAAFLLNPFAQGRLSWLRIFFHPETQKEIENAAADFIISAGSSLVPLNLCLAKENCGKSLIIMKPSFPFNLFRYDLALVPAHDRGLLPRESMRLLLTPNPADPADMAEAGDVLKNELPRSERVRTAVFLGGSTKRFRMDLSTIEKLLALLEKAGPDTGDYVLTTSRRTPPEVARFLKEGIGKYRRCQKAYFANEDSRPVVVPGMMSLAETLIVTEDSVSMISEAVSAGKKVVVLCLDSERLPAKHRRFREILRERSALQITSVNELLKCLNSSDSHGANGLIGEETASLAKRLEAIL